MLIYVTLLWCLTTNPLLYGDPSSIINSRWANRCYAWPYFTLPAGHHSGYQSSSRWHSTQQTLRATNVLSWRCDYFSPHYPTLTARLTGFSTHFSTKIYANKCSVERVVPIANRWRQLALCINIIRRRSPLRRPICIRRITNFVRYRLRSMLVTSRRRHAAIWSRMKRVIIVRLNTCCSCVAPRSCCDPSMYICSFVINKSRPGYFAWKLK